MGRRLGRSGQLRPGREVRTRRSALRGLFAFGASACGGASEAPRDLLVLGSAASQPAASPTSPPPAVATRNALDVMKAFGSARMGIVAHVARLASHPLGAALRSRLPFAESFERAGIDPTKDVDRLLLVDHKPHERSGMTLWEHHIPEDKLTRFMLAAVEESSPRGEVLERYEESGTASSTGQPVHRSPPPGRRTMVVRLSHRGFSGTSVTVNESLVLTSFRDDAYLARMLERSGGIPTPIGDELASFFLLEPSETLLGGVPRSLGDLHGDLVPTKSGGLTIRCSSPSTSPTEDAEYVRNSVPMLVEATLGRSGRMLLDSFVVKSTDRAVSAEVTLDRDATLSLIAILNLAVPLRFGF